MTKVLVASIKGPKGDTGDITPALVEARDTATAAAADAALSRDAAAVSADQAASAAVDAVADADIPGQVSAGITDSPTVTAAAQAAAVTAVNAEITARPLVEGGTLVESDIVFAVVDEDGRRTWLEVAANGGLTQRSASLIAPAVVPFVEAAVGVASQSELASGILFAVVDEDGRRTWLEAGLDGAPTQRAVDLLAARMNVQLPIPAVSGSNLLLIGHSMLAGAAAAIASAVSASRATTSIAVGGEGFATISGRWGSHPTRVLFSGGAIPASGPVTITLNADALLPLAQGPSTYAVTMILPDGTTVPGTFSKSGSDFQFTRTTSGSAITVTRPAVMHYDLAESHRSDTLVFWACRNGSWTATNAVRERLDRLDAAIRHGKALERRFLVLSEHIAQGTTDGTLSSDTTDTATAIADYNRQAYLRYGDRFIDTQQYLIDYGLADRGITPTTQDTTDIAAGRVPRSLRSDALHLNADGSAVVANLINRRLTEKGW